MDSNIFLSAARQILAENLKVTHNEVKPVWLTKVLQNNKGLFIVDGHDEYFEITYNGDKEEVYVDTYEKTNNIKIDVVTE